MTSIFALASSFFPICSDPAASAPSSRRYSFTTLRNRRFLNSNSVWITLLETYPLIDLWREGLRPCWLMIIENYSRLLWPGDSPLSCPCSLSVAVSALWRHLMLFLTCNSRDRHLSSRWRHRLYCLCLKVWVKLSIVRCEEVGSHSFCLGRSFCRFWPFELVWHW